MTEKGSFYGVIKRLLDILLSGTALVAFCWLFALLAILVKRDGGTAFFAQKRIGKGGKSILVYKFRSMRMNADDLEKCLTPQELAEYKKDFKLEHDPRITKIGHFLRKSSLDELPQLWNILRGDMSLIGPRPLLENELERYYTPEEREKLLSVRPGLTGYWQATSRNESSYQTGERQKQELYYIGRVNFPMDVFIFFKTVSRVFSGKGAV